MCLDEAELTLPAFLSDLESGQPKKIYRASGFCDLNDSPSPLLGFNKDETICIHESSVFKGMSV